MRKSVIICTRSIEQGTQTHGRPAPQKKTKYMVSTPAESCGILRVRVCVRIVAESNRVVSPIKS